MPLTGTLPARAARTEAGAGAGASPALWWIALAAAICLVAITSQRRIDLSLHDEGFLWYGAQRMLAGELPLRDFQAYDPGRYLWVAGWMAALGDDGVLAMRWANAALASITVALATWAAGSGSPRAGAALAVAGATFTLWMVPHFKVSDSFAVVLLLFGLTRLFQSPGIGRCVQGGACLGLASTIGINHALYGSIAALLALFHLRKVMDLTRAVPAAIAGGLAGYAPVLLLHLFAPGFTAAFFDGVLQLSEAGTTNLALSFPDPLAVLRADRPGLISSATQSLSALIFLGVPMLWAWAAWRMRRPGLRDAANPAIAAGLLLSVPYAHYAWSRADMVHLAVSILPVLAAVLAFALGTAAAVRRWLILVAAFGVSLVMTSREHPAYRVLKGDPMEAVEVGDARVLVRPDDATEIRAARAVAALAGTGAFFAGPYVPGAYALAGRKSPAWELYMLFPASPARQRAEIARIESSDVRYALISDDRVDSRPDLGLQRTHPLLLAYLRRCLDRSATVPGAPQLTIRAATGPVCRSRGQGGPGSGPRPRTAAARTNDGALHAR